MKTVGLGPFLQIVFFLPWSHLVVVVVVVASQCKLNWQWLCSPCQSSDLAMMFAGGFLFVATDCGGVKAQSVFAVSGAPSHPNHG